MDKVKAKVIELVPELQCPGASSPVHYHEGCPANRPITIADALRAIEKAYKPEYDSYSVLLSTNGTLEVIDFGGGYEPAVGQESCEWNLTADYDGQTQEVKDFIGKLLTP